MLQLKSYAYMHISTNIAYLTKFLFQMQDFNLCVIFLLEY